MSCENKSIAIVLTTYNPDLAALQENIKSYITQAAKLIVCDNSDDLSVANEIEKLCGAFCDAIYLSMDGNKGIAFAQNRGVELAISEGFEFFIEVDQDSKLPSGFVKNLFSSYSLLAKNNIAVAGIGPVAKPRSQSFSYNKNRHESRVEIVNKTLSSGFLYAKNSYQLVGGKDESLFIDYVDWDWCWRAKSLGLKVAIDTSIEIEHVFGEGEKKVLFFYVGLSAPVRIYYQYRNALYMMQKGYVPFWWKVRRFFILFLKLPFFLAFADRKIDRAYYMARGVIAFLKKEKGKVDQ